MNMLSMKKKRLDSTASVATNKGLLNEPGENNCFLNSAIQVLWHLDVFRRSFRLLDGHACMGASCIFCALKDIFEQFQYSKDRALPPNVLRSALAESFQQENRFQLGLMDDAAECFENILNRIHLHIGNTVQEDVCTAPHCIPHQKFGLTLVQQSVCSCGATSEPFPFIEMVHYVSATALCTENEAMCQRYGAAGVSQMFGRLIRVAGSWGDVRSCPSECGQKIEMRKVLMNCPDVVSIGIVWDSEEPNVRQIIDLVNALGTTLRLTDLFHTVVDERAMQLEMYLVGMVCYYGKHYSTFFFHTKLRKWVYFDDAQVSEVGKRWSNVITKCIKGHHQPLLLLYANPNANPVSVATAPKERTLMPGYSNHHLSNEQLYDIPETDSVISEDSNISGISEGSSETDIAANGRSNRLSAEMKYYEQSHSAKHLPPPPVHKSHTREKDRHSGSHSTSKDKSSRGHKQTASSASYDLHQLSDMSISNDKHHNESRKQEQSKPRRSNFQWHITDEQSQESQKKMGNYVEPQPANWSKPKPYESHKTQQSKSSNGQRKHVKLSPERNAVSVKAVDTQGMAAFCVTGKSTSSSNGSHDESRSPNPSARSKQADHVSIGRRSPGSSRRSSHSSHSSHRSGSSATSGAKSAHSTGSHPPLIDFEEDALHASTPQSRVNLITSVASFAHANQNRPHLPPKPPFLSRPLVGAPPPQIVIENTSLPKDASHRYENVPDMSRVNQHSFEKCPLPTSQTSERCIALFRHADDLLEDSRAADVDMDYSSALQFCLEATKAIETILMTENLPEEYMIKARIKHGDCVNKSRILHRRRNIRMKAQGSSGSRSSVLETDRHVTNTSNQILKPTRAPSSSGSSTSSSPTGSRKNLSIGRASPSREERFIEQLEQKDSRDNLIDFDKHGMTKFQHVVQNMFKRQSESKPSKGPRPSKPTHKKSNVNNSNNRKSAPPSEFKPIEFENDKKEPINSNNYKSAPQSESNPMEAEKDKKQPTNIFVFSSPPSTPQIRQPSDKPQATVPKVQQSKPEAKEALPNKPNSIDTRTFTKTKSEEPTTKDVEDKSKLPNPTSKSPRKFRSITPTPPSPTAPSVSQQRRSKTPTPAMNKELLRARQNVAQRRGSDLRLQTKSAVFSTSTNSITTNGPNAPNSGTSAPTTTSTVKPVTIGNSYRYPYQAWGSTSTPSPNFSPAIMPKEYYEQFYRWIQFYAALSPEQQKSFMAYKGNPLSPPFPNAPTSSHLTAPPAMQTAYVEQLKTHLGKNLANFTNSVGRATPLIKAANSNIYESAKPKPVAKAKSSTHLPSDERHTQHHSQQESHHKDSYSRQTSAVSRRAPVDLKPSNLHSRGEESLSTNHISSNASRDDRRSSATSRDHRRPNSSDSFDDLHSSSHSPQSKSNQSSPRHGMMKWTEEGKKRVPESDAESRNRLLQEFANRREPDKLKNSETFPDPPTALITPSTNIHSSEHLKLPRDKILPVKADTNCALCGLVAVPSPGDYCTSCHAYLNRFKPAGAMRVAKKI